MKLNKLFAAFMLIAATVFVGCEPVNPPGTGGPGNGQGGDKDTTQNNDTTQTVDPIAPDTIGWNIPAKCLTVAQAREICAGLITGDSTSTEEYYVMGWVKKVKEVSAQYGNATFYIEDIKGAGSQEDFEAYRVKGPNNQKINNEGAVAVGDFVVLYGKIKNFKGTYETSNGAYIWKSTNPLLTDNGSGNQGGNDDGGNTKPEGITGEGTYENPYTAWDVIALNNATKEVSGGNFYVKGYIVGQINGMNMSGIELSEPWSTQTNKTYQTNLVIAGSLSETNVDNMVPVQLPSGALRTGLNLPENPDMYGKEVILYGSLEGYFGAAGIKNATYAEANGKVFGTKPVESTGSEILNETLLTQASFDKFTAVSVSGTQAWTFDAKYGAKMSGYNGSSTDPNEDWFITPALNLAGKSNVTLTFNHAFGPASSVPTTEATKGQYTIWVSNDFNGDVATATWTQLQGMEYGTTAWGYVSSGDIAIPAANLKANCRIAWKYTCESVSATWEIKEVIVK